MIEPQEPDSTWRELARRFTIEFRGQAARPRSRLKREFTVPVDSPAARLRIAVRGIGAVAISHVALVNGVESRPNQAAQRVHTLGRAAPTHGLPRINWQKNTQAVAVRWRG